MKTEESPKHVPKRVQLFIAGDEKRTPFSAETMNELVRPINRVNNIVVGQGLQIKYSDSNVLIWLKGTPEPQAPTQPDGNPFSGSSGSPVTGGEFIPQNGRFRNGSGFLRLMAA